MFLLYSHDSCAISPAKPIKTCCAWWWAKTQSSPLIDQFNLGVRVFDIRYMWSSESNQFVTSHRFETTYTLKEALTQLVELSANDTIFIRLKRDWAGTSHPGLREILNEIPNIEKVDPQKDNLQQSLDMWEKYKQNLLKGKIVFYTDSRSPFEDGVLESDGLYHHQLFDCIETWMYDDMNQAINMLINPKFANNGLPKALFVEWCASFPPLVAHRMIWPKIKNSVKELQHSKQIQCVMVNFIDSEIVSELLS